MSTTPSAAHGAVNIEVHGNVGGPITVGDNNFIVNNNSGTVVVQAPKPPTTRRGVARRAPNPPLLFLDRTDEATQISSALSGPEPRAAALYGRDGVGKSSLLRRVANQPPGAYPDGIVLIQGERETGVALTLDEIAQDIFDTLYESDPQLKVDHNSIETWVANLNVLYLLDRLGLDPDALAKLPDRYRPLILTAQEAPRGDVAHTLPVPGLPRAVAIELLVQKTQWAAGAADPAGAATLDQICRLLEDLPLAIVTLARWALVQHATPAQALVLLQITEAAAETHGVRRALMAVISTLPEPMRVLLGLAGAAHGATVERAHLIEASGFAPKSAEDALDKLEALGLLAPHSPELSLHPAHRDLVRARLPASADHERTLAGIFLREAQARAQDLKYLRGQLGNLLGALERALIDNDPQRIRAVARLLVPVLVLRGLWDQWQNVFGRVAEAAVRSGERGLQGWALHELGTHALATGARSQAENLLTQALTLRHAIGDEVGAAYTQHNLDFLLGLPPVKPSKPPTPPAPPPTLVTVVALSVIGFLSGAGLLVAAVSVLFSALAILRTPTPRPPTPVVVVSPTPTDKVTLTAAPTTRTPAPASGTPTASVTRTPSPTATPSPSATPTPTATSSATATPTDTPSTPVLIPLRAQTVVLAWPLSARVGLTNPLAKGYTDQEGNNFLWEPLAYYGIFGPQEIPWLADSMVYDEGFTSLTIHLNPNAAWSDGQPLTSQDVAFTFGVEQDDAQLPEHRAFAQYVQDWNSVDDQTIILNFKLPAPRFKYEVLTAKFDSGLYILPMHALKVQPDLFAFTGGPQLAHSGPYNLASWDENQKTFDLREDWWAVKAGLIADPAVKHIQIVRIGPGSFIPTLDLVPVALAKNDIDTSIDLSAAEIESALKYNPGVMTWTGHQTPYGSIDWWTNSLAMDDQLAPYNDADVRKAIRLVIDRKQIDKDLYGGAHVTTIYPFPLYPRLQDFVNSSAVMGYVDKLSPGAYDPTQSAALMAGAGFHKNADGLWADSEGKVFNATINAVPGLNGDLAMELSHMLLAGGFDAPVNFGNDATTNMQVGNPGLYLFGHSASTLDPFATLDLYDGQFSVAPGSATDVHHLTRYKNGKYDEIVHALAVLDPNSAQFTNLAAQELATYWAQTIDIPIAEWIQRVPYNTAYWTNWPTAQNPVLGTTGAFWSKTGVLVITELQPPSR
jgi:peptide/nickel transport system substrate-binding protein